MKSEFFDFKKVADEAGITSDKLEELYSIFQADYPHDQNLMELHILRACMSIRDGHVTLEQLLQPEPELQTS